MNVTEPFVLQKDVLLIPCAELDEEVRARLTFDEGDYTLSRRRGRAPAQVIDGETAALLGLFREPRTLVDAVVDSSRTLGKDPRQWFDELLPHFARLVDTRVLVPAGGDEENEIEPRYESGEIVAGWEIVRCARFLEDTEIYQVRKNNETAALKIARLNTPQLQSIFANEIEILRRLDTPRLIEHGTEDERPYVIMEWLDGVDASVASAQRRHDRAALLDLCTAVADAYVQLHARGVLHADVHARNVMVGDKVALLDFGYSQLGGSPSRTGRAGMYYFYEPELIAAMRNGERLPPPTEAGEQYSIAALLYLLITGEHYLEFRYDRDEMRQQIETDPPVPFAQRGLAPWPEVEQILFRALEKDPSRRHASVAEMAALLANVRAAAGDEPLSPAAHALLDSTLRSFSRGGAMYESGFTKAPTASINFGCAGAAVALLQIAETRSNPSLLALADIWRSRAVARIGTEGAYYHEPGLRRAVLGEVTPYHTESGIHAAAAMVAAAMGDVLALRSDIRQFLTASTEALPNARPHARPLRQPPRLGDAAPHLRRPRGSGGIARVRRGDDAFDLERARCAPAAVRLTAADLPRHGARVGRLLLRRASLVRCIRRCAAATARRAAARIRVAEDRQRPRHLLGKHHRAQRRGDDSRLVQRQRGAGLPLHPRASSSRR